LLGVLDAGNVVKEETELFSADASSGVRTYCVCGETPGDFLQGDVADVVAVGVVDVLEAVYVDTKQGGLPVRLIEGLPESGFEPCAVWEAGELIVTGLVAGGEDLLFKQDEDHAEGYKVFGDVPELGTDAADDAEMLAECGGGKDGCPGEKTEDDGECATGETAEGPHIDQADEEVKLRENGQDAEVGPGVIDGPKKPEG